MEELIKKFQKSLKWEEQESTLESYARSIDGEKGVLPFGVVFPRKVEEVREVILEARKEKLPLIPVSSKEPHFRDDTLPKEGGVMVDMREMRKIMRIDRKNRVAVVEPGVTFEEFIPALREKGLRPNMPLIPRAGKSVVGSALEREPVIMPRYHWDASDPLLCVEVVFGTGDVFRTGEAAGPGSLEEQWKIGGAQKFPLGPHQVDYFRLIQGAQGTMGIVTWASIKCELLPEWHQILIVEDEVLSENLIDFFYKIMKLDLVDEGFILNSVNFEKCFNMKPSAQWILLFGVGGAGKWGKERVEYKIEDIKDVAKEHKVEVKNRINGEDTQKISENLWNVQSQYWKLKNDVSLDIFFITTLNRVNYYVDEFKNFLKERGSSLESLGIYLQPLVQGTSCHLEFNLYTSEKELSRTREVFEKGSEFLFEKGAFFSRPYGIWANFMFETNRVYSETLKKIKSIFDPDNILNPGKLCF